MKWIKSTPLAKNNLCFIFQGTEGQTDLTVILDIDEITNHPGLSCYATVKLNGDLVLGSAFDARNRKEAKRKTEETVREWIDGKLKTFTDLAKILWN